MNVLRGFVGGSRRGVRTTVEIASLGVTVFAALNLPAHAGTLTETDICRTGSSVGNTSTCIDMFSSGRYIDHVQATARVNHSGRRLKVCIVGPVIDQCVGPYYVGPFDTIISIWRPKADEMPGRYQAVTYRLNPDGTYSKIGVVTVPID